MAFRIIKIFGTPVIKHVANDIQDNKKYLT